MYPCFDDGSSLVLATLRSSIEKYRLFFFGERTVQIVTNR